MHAIAPLSSFPEGMGKRDLQLSTDNNFISIAIQKRAMYMLLNEFHTPNQFNAQEEKKNPLKNKATYSKKAVLSIWYASCISWWFTVIGNNYCTLYLVFNNHTSIIFHFPKGLFVFFHIFNCKTVNCYNQALLTLVFWTSSVDYNHCLLNLSSKC